MKRISLYLAAVMLVLSGAFIAGQLSGSEYAQAGTGLSFPADTIVVDKGTVVTYVSGSGGGGTSTGGGSTSTGTSTSQPNSVRGDGCPRRVLC